MKVTSNDDNFSYENKKINALLQRYIYDKGEYGNKFEFEYKNNNVFMFYEENHRWYQLAQIICKLIDKYGSEGYEKFYEYYQEKEKIVRKYIIVNEKVYKPYIYDKVRSGSTTHYIINMKMADSEFLDGVKSGDIGTPFYNDVCDKNKLINTLRQRVQAYYEKQSILPSNQHYDEKVTDKYLEIIKWYNENEIQY